MRSAIAVLAATIVSACAGTAYEDAAEATPSITAAAQPAGPSLTIASAVIPEAGFVAIHAFGPDGKPVVPGSVGSAPLAAGANTDVVVRLDRPSQPGEKYLAMLHTDTGRIGTYEFGPGSVSDDGPVIYDEQPVVAPIAIR